MKVLILAIWLLVWVIAPILFTMKKVNDPRQIAWDRVRPCKFKGGVMNYFIAGTLNQPKGAFAFLDENSHRLTSGNPDKVETSVANIEKSAIFEPDEGFTYIPYQNLGVNFDAIIARIQHDVHRNRYSKIRIFTISVGDIVPRYLASHPFPDTDMMFYEINPCGSADFLQPKIRPLIKYGGAALLSLLDRFVGGWISLIPLISQSGEKFSLRSVTDQLWSIARGGRIKMVSADYLPENVERFIFISSKDELLDNKAITRAYADDPIFEVDSHHGDTIGAGLRYYKSVAEVLLEQE